MALPPVPILKAWLPAGALGAKTPTPSFASRTRRSWPGADGPRRRPLAHGPARASAPRRMLGNSRSVLSPSRGLAPGDQTADSLAHIDLGTPAKGSLGQAVIHRPSAAGTQLHLARFGLDVLGLKVLAGKFGDEPHDLKGGRWLWPGDVDRDIAGIGGECGSIGAGRIAHVHKMLGVGPVANDARATSLTHAVVGFDDVEGIGGTIVLALAIDR